MKNVSETDARTVALQFVRELGLSLSTEAENELAVQVHEALRFDPNSRTVVMVDSAGHPMVKVGSDGTVDDLSLLDFVAQAAARLGATPKAQSKPKPQSKGGMTITERMRASIEGRRANRKELAAQEAARGPNPWAQKTINRSRQGLITNLDPDLAARLRQEAGVQS
jgi:hypothetical protein